MRESRELTSVSSSQSSELPAKTAGRAGRAVAPGTSFLVAVGIFLATAVLMAAGPGSGEFWTSLHARLWHLMLGLQAVLWVWTLASVRGDLRELGWDGRSFGLALVAFAFASVPSLIRLGHGHEGEINFDNTLLPGAKQKLLAFTLTGVAVASVHAYGLFAVRRVLAREGETSDAREAFRRVSAQVRRFLRAAGLIIAAAMVSSGALRELIAGGAAPYPSSVLISYGLYFTALLAFIYLPLHRVLAKKGAAVVDALAPAPKPPVEAGRWNAWAEDVAALEEHLGLKKSSFEELEASLAVLAPLLGSVAGVLSSKG